MLNVPDPSGLISFGGSIGQVKKLDYYGELRDFIVYPAPAVQEMVRDMICEAIRSYLYRSMSVETDDISIAYRNGYVYTDGTVEASRPTPRRTKVKVKEGIVHKDFKARVRAGEIIVSDYERAEIEVISYPGYASGASHSVTAYMSTKSLLEAGVLVPITVNGEVYPSFKGYTLPYRTWSDSNEYMYTRQQADYGEWVFGTSVTADSVLHSLRLHQPEVESMAVKVLAKANRSCVDVLTAFAELPKSIESLYRGFILVASILRDAKKGQFNVTKAYALRDKRRSVQYFARMKRLDRELSNPLLKPSRRAALQSHKDKTTVGHREYLARSAEELATALSGVWLNYRYNIMPNVYLAQDVYDATQKFGREWITARETMRDSFSIPISSGMRIDVDGKVKMTIKRSFSGAFASSGLSVISNDIFVTAWELVPLSFVYDWFINIGDFLQAQNYQKSWTQEGNTLAYSYKCDTVLTPPVDKLCIIEPRLVIRGFYYRRDVINPIDYCGLVWKPKLGLERQIDALALAWKPVRSILQKGRNR